MSVAKMRGFESQRGSLIDSTRLKNSHIQSLSIIKKHNPNDPKPSILKNEDGLNIILSKTRELRNSNLMEHKYSSHSNIPIRQPGKSGHKKNIILVPKMTTDFREDNEIFAGDQNAYKALNGSISIRK